MMKMSMSVVAIFSCLFAMSASNPSSAAQNAAAPNFTVSLTEKLSHQFAASGFPGGCVAIVKNNRIVYQHGFGYANVQSKAPYTTTTIQPIGSVSKTLIGVAIMKAVEMGYFSLDTKINDILPFRVSNPNFPNSPITLRQLATHTSGIVDREEIYEKTYLFGRSESNISLHTFLSSYFTPGGRFYSSRNFAPEEPSMAFHYSNIGATLAAYAIEVKTRKPFAEFARQCILQPLQMTSSDWFSHANNSNRMATLYTPRKAPYPIYASITYPDGSLRSSCADLCKYLIALMQGYYGHSTRLLHQSSFQQLFSPQFSPKHLPSGLPKHEPNQGIFFVFRHDGSLGHTGSDYGVSAFLFFNPRTNTGKIFLTNIDIQENPRLAREFVEIWKTLGN